MIIDLKTVLQENSIIPKGVIHVGGYNGEEIFEYKDLGINNMAIFEPQKNLYEQILLKKGLDENILAYNFGLGSKTTKQKMYKSINFEAASSFLQPSKVLSLYPGLIFEETLEEFEIHKMDDVIKNKNLYNILNIDVQGFELEVLRGGEETLKNIEVIICEVNRDYLYNNNAQIHEIDEFLSAFKFKRLIVNWIGDLWGDACYIKC